MSGVIPEPDGELSAENKAVLARLSSEEIAEIDRELLARASSRWQKVAKLVASTILERPDLAPQLPDVFFAQRVTSLVEDGKLESQGTLGYMGFCEVRIADAGRNAENT